MEVGIIADLIKAKHDFMIISHENPDGDCIGSMLGLHLLFKSMGKTSVMVNADLIPDSYSFLSSVEKIVTSPPNRKFDVAIVVDCATLSRMGDAQNFLKMADIVVNIDHHKSNEFFGDINLVCSEVAASGEIIFEIIKAFELKLTPELATSLFTAISTDTGSFKFSNTNFKTFRIAAELVEAGAKPDVVAENVFDSKPYATLKLLGDVLKSLKVSPCGRVSWVTISNKKMKEFDVSEEQTEGFVNYVRMVEGAQVSVLLREQEDGGVRVSWRSKGDIDVSNLAGLFGGGGHARAAGCTIEGKTLKEAESDVLKVVYDALQ